MKQSSVIFANLSIAYLLYITLKGELPTYLTLLRGGGTEANSGSGNAGGNNAVTQGAQALLNGSSADLNNSGLFSDSVNEGTGGGLTIYSNPNSGIAIGSGLTGDFANGINNAGGNDDWLAQISGN